MTLKTQFRNNLLALISLLVAFSALGYNTWRNELTELNRNVRFAGFEILRDLSELQRITYLLHYDKDIDRNTPRDGWAVVLVIRDFSKLMPSAVAADADSLLKIWGSSWAGLGSEDKKAVADIDNAIKALREETLAAIQVLD